MNRADATVDFLPFSNLHQVLFSNTEELLPIALPQIIRDSSHKECGTFATWRDRSIHLHKEYKLKAFCVRFLRTNWSISRKEHNLQYLYAISIHNPGRLIGYFRRDTNFNTWVFLWGYVSQLVGFYHLHPAMWISNLGDALRWTHLPHSVCLGTNISQGNCCKWHHKTKIWWLLLWLKSNGTWE